jgi:hypothetical protein
MNRLSLITISMHELDRVKIIEAVLGRRMKPGQAAQRLQLTTRQILRPKTRRRRRILRFTPLA